MIEILLKFSKLLLNFSFNLKEISSPINESNRFLLEFTYHPYTAETILIEILLKFFKTFIKIFLRFTKGFLSNKWSKKVIIEILILFFRYFFQLIWHEMFYKLAKKNLNKNFDKYLKFRLKFRLMYIYRNWLGQFVQYADNILNFCGEKPKSKFRYHKMFR